VKSDIIAVSMTDIGKALDLVERTVIYIGYSDSFAEKMRLLAEELISGNRFIIDEVTASLWVETDQENMQIHLKLEGALTPSARDKLIEISKTQCNQPPKGIFNKIGAFFSDAFMQQTAEYTPLFMVNGEAVENLYIPYSVVDMPKKDTSGDDEDMNDIEKNILKGLADDVTVCAYASHAELVVVKKLPQTGKEIF